jgi:hypothetical protein
MQGDVSDVSEVRLALVVVMRASGVTLLPPCGNNALGSTAEKDKSFDLRLPSLALPPLDVLFFVLSFCSPCTTLSISPSIHYQDKSGGRSVV